MRSGLLEYTQRGHANAPPQAAVATSLAWLIGLMRMVNESPRNVVTYDVQIKHATWVGLDELRRDAKAEIKKNG